MTSYTESWQVVKNGFITLIQKQNDTACNGITQQPKKELTTMSLVHMATVTILDAQRCVLVKFLQQGETISAVHYLQMLQKLCRPLREKCPGKKMNVLQYDNARPHTAHVCIERIQKSGWEVLPIHPIVWT